MITIDELKAKLGGMKTAVDDLRDALSIEASEKRLAELEHQMTMPGFYDDQARSQKVISEMGEVKNKLERFGKLSTQYEEAETLLLMIEEENDPSLAAEGEEAVNGVEKSIDELQLMTMLNGEYDHNNAILTFHAGTGGTEARCIRDTLVSMGIAPGRIYLEDASTSTEENLAFSAEVIRREGLPTEVAIASDNFHQLRAGVWAEKDGLTPYSLGCASIWMLGPGYWAREAAALLYMGATGSL